MGGTMSGSKTMGTFLHHSSDRHAGMSRFPQASSVTYEGVFYQHYFQVEPTETEAAALRFGRAVCSDPLSGSLEHFLCLGITSKYDGAGLRRHGGRGPVQLMFVLDVSGSMGGHFEERTEKTMRRRLASEVAASGTAVAQTRSTKMQAAIAALIGLLDNLKEGDWFGLVLFNHAASVAIPLHAWGTRARPDIEAVIRGCQAFGGTTLHPAFEAAQAEYARVAAASAAGKCAAIDSDGDKKMPLQRRVFFLTDMQINTGQAATDHLIGLFSQAAEQPVDPIYSTIIGFGIDFNTQLTEALSQVKCCNYFTVHSAEEFLEQMTWEFDYLCFPVAYDLTVKLADPEAAQVVAVCGAPAPLKEQDSDTLLYVNSLFPSQTQGPKAAEAKGSVIVVKLQLKDPAQPLRLHTCYTTFDGLAQRISCDVSFAALPQPHFDTLSIRKAVALTHWVALMKAFLIDVESRQDPSANEKTGLPYRPADLAALCLTPNPDAMHALYQPVFKKFLEYFNQEMEAVADDLSMWRDSLSKHVIVAPLESTDSSLPDSSDRCVDEQIKSQ